MEDLEAVMAPALLCHFAATGDIVSLDALLDSGADVDTPSRGGRTAAHVAAAEVSCDFFAPLVQSSSIHCHTIFNGGVVMIARLHACLPSAKQLISLVFVNRWPA
jgi:ankyrin repeat protein